MIASQKFITSPSPPWEKQFNFAAQKCGVQLACLPLHAPHTPASCHAPPKQNRKNPDPTKERSKKAQMQKIA
jgi:hypothetical protein